MKYHSAIAEHFGTYFCVLLELVSPSPQMTLNGVQFINSAALETDAHSVV